MGANPLLHFPSQAPLGTPVEVCLSSPPTGADLTYALGLSYESFLRMASALACASG